MTRSYEQACHIARALDVLGERWTLLIVRELVLGPRRYGDLIEALPGMGTSLLAARLKHLEQQGIARRTTLPGPGRAAGYELGERGESLLPVLASLTEWGAGLGPAPSTYRDRAAWSMVAMRLRASAEAAAFDTLTDVAVGDERLWLQGDGERLRMELGPSPTRPGLQVSCAKDTFRALARAELSVADAISTGVLVVCGDPDLAREFFALFSLPAAVA